MYTGWVEWDHAIKITSLSSNGEGIGTLDGKKIFVEGALPDEVVTIKITEQKKTYAKAESLSLITPSHQRTEPVCPLFGTCGGCQIMHMQYPAQLLWKEKRVRDALHRIGKFHDIQVAPCIPSPTSIGYRNKIQLPVVWERGKKSIGLYRKKSHEVIPINRCMIQCPQGEHILNLIIDKLTLPQVSHVLIRNAVFNEEALVVFVTTGPLTNELKTLGEELMDSHSLIKGVVENFNIHHSNTILGPNFRLLAGRPYIYEKLSNKIFKISPAAFFQVNPGQTENLYAKVIEMADIGPQEAILDAYCGVGTLAIFAAEKAKLVYGIESVSKAVADAIENARLNHLKNCIFLCGKAEEKIKEIDSIDTLFLNPPRKGCAPELLQIVLEKKPKKIIYISCDPATLARDLAILKSSYHLQAAQPFDMFPQTMHVETVACLVT